MTHTIDPVASGEGAPPPTAAGPPGWPAGPYPYPYTFEEPGQDRISRFFAKWWARSPVWLAPVAVLGCMAAAAGYTLAADRDYVPADQPQTCLLKLTTGLDCPGCGGTRAFWYLLHGSLPAAARHHAPFVFALPFLLYLYVQWAGQRMFRWRLPALRISGRSIIVFLAFWLVFSVARNLPWEPFTWFYV